MWQTLHFRPGPLKYDDEYRKWNTTIVVSALSKPLFIKFILRVLRTITFFSLPPLTNTYPYPYEYNNMYIKFHHKHPTIGFRMISCIKMLTSSAHLNNKSMAQNDPIRKNQWNQHFFFDHSLCLSVSAPLTLSLLINKSTEHSWMQDCVCACEMQSKSIYGTTLSIESKSISTFWSFQMFCMIFYKHITNYKILYILLLPNFGEEKLVMCVFVCVFGIEKIFWRTREFHRIN